MTTSMDDAAVATWLNTPHILSDTIPDLKPSTREVLEKYSRIPADEVMPHVYDIRARAFAIHPYGCINLGRFLDMAVADHPLYPEVLQRLRPSTDKTTQPPETYLDLGCAFAQDLRRLVTDGVDSQNLYASDLRLDFLDLGFELFRDRETLKSTFIEADIFDPENKLKEIEGKIDIVGASSFFHLFELPEQKAAARRVIKLLKQKQGSLIIGRQMGSYTPGPVERRINVGSRYRHNAETWRAMWDEVGAEFGLKFETAVTMVDLTELVKNVQLQLDRIPDEAGMWFSVRIL